MAGFADKGMIRMIIRQRRGKQISALLLMTVILCCGCSNHSSWQKAKDRYVVGVVTKSNTSEYWMSVNSGMEAAAAKYDMDVITLAPDSELDREVQEKQVEKLIDQNVDALAVAPIDSYHVPDYLDEIEKRRLRQYVLTMEWWAENFHISESTIIRQDISWHRNWQNS